MESFTVAVIGRSAVGKSSFIQRVLGLPRPPISNTSSVGFVVDQVAHMVTLLEIDLASFELNSSQPISWPKQINGNIVPKVDASLILYNVVDQASIRGLSQMIAALTNPGLPAVLVACKCDSPKDDWEVDADGFANHKVFKPCVASYKTSMDRPDISKACLQTILRAAIAQRRDESGETVPRKRAQSAVNLEVPDPAAGRPLSEHGKHSRASSDFSVLRGFPNPQASDTYRTRGTRLGFRMGQSGADSFLELEESDEDSHEYADDIPILQRGDDIVVEKQPRMAGVSFDELVDRLLALRLSRADNNFSDVFLCLYRKFAAPGDLFSAILVRLDRVRDDKAAHYLTKTATQLRIIEVVAKWVSLYPGDFGRPTTRRNLEDFITHLSTEPIFSIASQQMRRNLRFNVIVDDDTGWANADDAGDEIASKILSKEMGQLSDGISTLQFGEELVGRRSNSSETSGPERGNTSGSQLQFNSPDEYEREAALLEPRTPQPMNKFRYHIFMDITDEHIADELTRIDWIMFSSIRIRDFVRHVSLSAAEKEKCKSLQSINRMINHFNHIAQWVANMVLLRDKPKHRAQMLEKFMNIALKLRQLNNYNGLAAVLAGINGTAIHRLAQTRGLVPADVQKRFARLVILMGTQKSHFAYRLAWENSPLPRIPFIPLPRRDLVSAEEGSKTFVGPNRDRINWKKFEVLGEVLLPMMKSQGTAYPNLAKHDSARDLILGCRMPTDDEEIYQRSLQVESNSSGPLEPSKNKFPWFAK
ncbi:Ras guanine nucleotide exchange factor [Ophiocordyceps sinensis CO18]|uniref:Ras guanine nucleotide exchange factor n=1 Tax=Ophiocordyceps sinensis (strain Co18 / CGMCC 3.14243) TaxID=911162 RepID=T5AAM9_OPHSC|nr:Ras guanine nucleotide exchange factor [Ophiocordyceps sinensis CO18]